MTVHSPLPLTGEHLRAVRLVVFDFDGVFTDNRVLVGQDGSEYVFCSRGDGFGIEALRRLGIGSLVISKESNPVVKVRADKLNIECVHGCDDKSPALSRILDDRALPPSAVAYVGNDINDIDCFQHVGVAICVADGHPDALGAAAFVTRRPGGRGAVREVCDLLVKTRTAVAT